MTPPVDDERLRLERLAHGGDRFALARLASLDARAPSPGLLEDVQRLDGSFRSVMSCWKVSEKEIAKLARGLAALRRPRWTILAFHTDVEEKWILAVALGRHLTVGRILEDLLRPSVSFLTRPGRIQIEPPGGVSKVLRAWSRTPDSSRVRARREVVELWARSFSAG